MATRIGSAGRMEERIDYNSSESPRGKEAGTENFLATAMLTEPCTSILNLGLRRTTLACLAVCAITKVYAQFTDIDGITPHVVRHTFTRSLIDRGMDLVTIQKIIGSQDVRWHCPLYPSLVNAI
jgi:site-specific recombinase XerC